MATLPRSAKPNTPNTSVILRPHSALGFDAGINTSTAWTEHLERSISDEEPDEEPDDETEYRTARALYAFEGKAEFRELEIEAGATLYIVKEELADGWSLVKTLDGEMGLLPRSYYTFTLDFQESAQVTESGFRTRTREASSSTITPRGSPTPGKATLPITPQTTGDWRSFPSFTRSLLGGKSLNRFSSFVTSGAEDWVLNGTAVDEPVPSPQHHRRETTIEDDGDSLSNRISLLTTEETERHFVEAGPSWRPKLPPFQVLVHSPSKRTSTLTGAFTMYSVTSLFRPPLEDGTVESPTRITVYRRFSHFVLLHTALCKRLPGIALPPLPEKQYTGRFSDAFVEARRGDLERYIARVVRHPVARYAEVLTFFLSCENDLEWKRLAPQYLSMSPAGPSFYSRVYHPAFNLDAEDAAEVMDRFQAHTRAVGKSVQGLRSIFGRVREARAEMSGAERLLSYSLLSLITSKPLASIPTTGTSEEEDDYSQQGKGLLNEEGAWCWKEGCEECLCMTKALQKTSEALQTVADLYDDHARRTQLATHEALKNVAHPASLYSAVMQTHRSALSRYQSATTGERDDAIASRCETVLNTTMAEMDTYHIQKVEDFTTLAKEHLDGEINLYQQIVSRLQAARSNFDPPQYRELGLEPRGPSFYERELENPRLVSEALSQPCPHVFDSAPMRPVSVAIQEGVGMLLGGGNRGSVFGRFWS